MWWFLTRATGVVATMLLALSLVLGLKFSSRETGKRLKAAWWLDLHKQLGGLTFGMTVAHIICVLIDPDSGFNITSAFVPGAANDQTGAVAYGIVATYILGAVVATSWPRLRLRRRVWRMVHVLSLPAGALTAMHAIQLGSDAQSRWLPGLLAGSSGAVLYPSILRIARVHRRSVAANASSNGPAYPSLLQSPSETSITQRPR